LRKELTNNKETHNEKRTIITGKSKGLRGKRRRKTRLLPIFVRLEKKIRGNEAGDKPKRWVNRPGTHYRSWTKAQKKARIRDRTADSGGPRKSRGQPEINGEEG